MRLFLYVGLGLVVLALLYVRLAPSPPDRWHRPIGAGPSEDDALGRYTLRRPAAPGDLARLDAIARATPRTTRLAGRPEAGRVTWITRSRLIGFPDYTTAEVEAGELRVQARLRFGLGDGGVNRARVQRWLAALDAEGGARDG